MMPAPMMEASNWISVDSNGARDWPNRNGDGNDAGIDRQRHGQRGKRPSECDRSGMNRVGGHLGVHRGFGCQKFPAKRTHHGPARNRTRGIEIPNNRRTYEPRSTPQAQVRTS